ncbi:nickel-dependent hydrogenase large subunit [Desulfonatronum parangueonense]
MRAAAQGLPNADFSVQVEQQTQQVSVVLQSSTVNILPGGTAEVLVKLSDAPSQGVTVNVVKTGGGSGVQIVSGASLTFTSGNWDSWQVVSLSADPGAGGTQAAFEVNGNGVVGAGFTVQVEQQVVQLSVVLQSDSVSISPGSMANVQVRLSGAPIQNVTVNVVKTGGSTGIHIASGAVLIFTPTNWSNWQNVSLSADPGAGGAQATFEVSGGGVVPATFTALVSAATINSVVIDPVTRIEGRLRVQLEMNGNTVVKAWSTAALFRGIEQLLVGRDPRDAPLITQRVCGVCTYVHGECSIQALENSANNVIPENARLVRNLLLGAQFLHDHIVHFYHLQGLDWIDVHKALLASPSATQSLAQSRTPAARPIDYAAVQSRLQTMMNTGNHGLFAGGHFGHPGYKLSPEENLLLVGHYLEALKVQVNAARMMAVLGGKNPHPAAMVPGGMTCGGELFNGRLADFNRHLVDVRDFVRTILMPDAELLAERHSEYALFGGSPRHLVFGGFPLSANLPADYYLPQGIALLSGNSIGYQSVDMTKITEDVSRAWYSSQTAHPSTGATSPSYDRLNLEQRYTWSKAPRYNGMTMEVGPLSRVLVAMAAQHEAMNSTMGPVMNRLNWDFAKLNSIMGRIVARVVESQVIANIMGNWSSRLASNISGGNLDIFRNVDLPKAASGVGLGEAPRGSLGHWLRIGDDGRIANYQMVVPSTWNFGPRDAQNQPGPVEKCLEGLVVVDNAKPLEVMRLIHSFDPCIACAVHCIELRNVQTETSCIIQAHTA